MARPNRLWFLILLAGMLTRTSGAADVLWSYQSLNTSPQALRSFWVYPWGSFTNGAGAIVTRDRVSKSTDASGQLIVSNVYGGIYYSVIQGTFTTTTNWYNFPVTNGLINAADWITNATVLIPATTAYSKAESDERYAQVSQLGKGATLNVSKSGDDLFGSRGGLDFLTITAAKAAAVSGDMIDVWPGIYDEINLLKPGVNYLFEPGAMLAHTNTGFTLADGLGFFDDRGTGATTNRIYGSLDFYYNDGTNLNNGVHGNTNFAGALVLTNPASDIVLDCRLASADCWGDAEFVNINGIGASPSVFYIARTTNCEIRCTEMICPGIYKTPNGVASTMVGLYWENGTTYLKASHIGPFSIYGIWPNTQTSTFDNLWITADLCEGYIYSSVASLKTRCWYDFKELRVTNSSAGSAFATIGGRHYLRAEKMSLDDSSGQPVMLLGGTFNTENWITLQKLTTQNTQGAIGSPVANTTNHILIQQIELLGSGPIFSANNGSNVTYLSVQDWGTTSPGSRISVSGGASLYFDPQIINGVNYFNSNVVWLGASNHVTGIANIANLTAGTITNRAGTANTLALNDGSAQPKLTSLANGGANALVHGTTPPTYGPVVEADQSLTDITTGNASTSRHGYMAKLDGVATHYFDGTGAQSAITNIYEFCLSDESTAISSTGTKLTWRAPHGMTLKDCRASLTTVSSSGIPTINILESGVTIFSTKLTIDANELTSTTAATPYVFSDTSIADDAQITFSVDITGTGATGLKVKLYYTR